MPAAASRDSVQWIIDTVGELAGIRKPLPVAGQPRANEILDVVADVARAGRARLAAEHDPARRPGTRPSRGCRTELAAAR